MATFTIEADKAVRVHLSELAKVIKRKFSATAYQGEWTDTITDTTLGDRLQVGTQRKIGGARYLFVLTLLVSRNAGGQCQVRVSAWSMEGSALVGTWAVGRTKLDGMTLTAKGFVRRVGNVHVARNNDEMTQRLESFLNLASETIKASLASNEVSAGRPVQLLKGYSPSNPLYGETYDTSSEHLLVFGGYDGATARLTK